MCPCVRACLLHNDNIYATVTQTSSRRRTPTWILYIDCLSTHTYSHSKHTRTLHTHTNTPHNTATRKTAHIRTNQCCRHRHCDSLMSAPRTVHLSLVPPFVLLRAAIADMLRKWASVRRRPLGVRGGGKGAATTGGDAIAPAPPRTCDVSLAEAVHASALCKLVEGVAVRCGSV